MFKAAFKSITRPALAATLAASVALSPLAVAPAQADQTTDAIAAAAILGILGLGIVSNMGAPNPQVTINRTAPARQPAYTPPTYRQPDRFHRIDPRKSLPGQCEFTIPRGHDRGTYFDRRCLKQKFDFWGYLPGQCETNVTAPNRARGRSYDARCLSRYGYQVAENRTRWGN